MNFNFNFFAILILLGIAVHLSNAKNLVTKSPYTGGSQTTTKRVYECVCGETGKPVCANNGVTYKNKCRFECAQSKLDGLRIVKEGDCGKYTSNIQFWSFG